jgi:hypothetical protein
VSDDLHAELRTPFALEAVERGMKRALLDLQDVSRHLLRTLSNAVAMNGPKSDDPQDEQVQSSLRQAGVRRGADTKRGAKDQRLLTGIMLL